MDLDALAIFHLVASNGGFGRAARANGRPKATLSRRVAELERSLGFRLFERGSGSLRLTEEGRSLLASTQGPLDELSAAEDALRGRGAEPRGRLRVSVPLLLGGFAMGELSALLLARHPKIRLEITAEDRYVDLIQEGYDVAIRANPKTDDDLVGRCFMRDQLLVVASPKLSRPIIGADSGSALFPAIVRVIGDDGGTWVVDDGLARIALHPEPVLRLTTLAMQDAVLAGAGAAVLPSFFVREHIEARRLVSWGVLVESSLEMWVLHASTRLASAKIRAFVNLMLEAFAAGRQAWAAAKPSDLGLLS